MRFLPPAFWTWAMLCGFALGVAFFAVIGITLREGEVWWHYLLGALLASVLGTVGFAHFVFLSLMLARLQRRGYPVKLPKAIARLLGKILDGISMGI